MRLTFLGGVQSVTGANYLLEDNGDKILVDCGLFQHGFFCDDKNFEEFEFNPKEIKALILTHAHIDHSGRIPLLVKRGFKGSIYATPATLDFAKVMLLDSQGVLEKEAKYHKRQVIYEEKDVYAAIELFKAVEYDEKVFLSLHLSFILREAGHILGSSCVEIFDNRTSKKTIFSGDLGNYPNPLLKSPFILKNIDYLLVESTYGDRLHGEINLRHGLLEDVIEETIKREGVLMIPAFAMERTQELLYDINELVENGRIPRVPIFIDSPLAIKVTSIYGKYQRFYNKKANDLIKTGDEIFKFPGLILTELTEESKNINDVKPPKIIIAGSGASNGGRILHHEKLYLSDPRNTLLIVGYQPVGSLGKKLLDGAKKVKILGKEIEVRAEIKNISGYSAHADQEGILNWLKPARETLKRVFVVQGEANVSEILATKIRDELAVEAVVPKQSQSFILD